MKPWSLAAVGLAACVFGVVATAPATLMDSGLRRVSDGKLRLVEAQGTLWSGTGRIEIRDAAGRAGVAGHLAWRVRSESWWRGRLVCDVALEQAAKPFPVTISLLRLELADADIGLPAAVFGLALPKLAPLGLSGDLLLHITSFAIESAQTSGHVTMRWRNAGSALTPIFPLGAYQLDLEGEGATAHALLRTLQGPLQLDGHGSWERGGDPRFMLVARVPPQHRQQLGPLLGLIAVERGAGSFELINP